MKHDPRQTAVDILLSWDRSSFTLDRILSKNQNVLNRLGKKDKKLCNALVFGVLRSREFLDWHLSQFVNIPFKKIETRIFYILRTGLFQIMQMDRIPDFAAINTSVEMAKKRGGKKAAGFVNAVLRNACKNHAKILLPEKKKPAKHMSVKYSLPMWIAKRWINAHGLAGAESLCKSINSIPEITIRANSIRIDPEKLALELALHVKKVRRSSYARDGILFSGPGMPVNEMNPFRQGLFQVQDEAAQLAGEILSPGPGERILDACAGLGGKTGHIAQLMENKGEVWALDNIEEKLLSLESEMERLKFDIVKTKKKDLLKASKKDFGFLFDRVLLDAPCSGLGVLRRNPDARWKKKEKSIIRHGENQLKMLLKASDLVRPGGIICYCVCSCEKEETTDVMDFFLDKKHDFSIKVPEKKKRFKDYFTGQGFLRTHPVPDSMDGFFMALLKKKG